MLQVGGSFELASPWNSAAWAFIAIVMARGQREREEGTSRSATRVEQAPSCSGLQPRVGTLTLARVASELECLAL